MNNAANNQARLSAIVKPREGACLNVMDAEAHARQAQHRNRYAGVSVAPMHSFFDGVGFAVPRPMAQVNNRAY